LKALSCLFARPALALKLKALSCRFAGARPDRDGARSKYSLKLKALSCRFAGPSGAPQHFATLHRDRRACPFYSTVP
jgi:hypothetical protein